MALDVNFEGPRCQRTAPDFIFEGPGRRRMALNSYFEGSSVLDFGEEGSSVLDFGDDRFFSFGLWRRWVLQFLDLVFQSVYPQFVSWTPNLSDSHFEGTGIQLESQFEMGAWASVGVGSSAGAGAGAGARAGGDFLDENFEGLRLLRGLRLLG
ncbi:uncharacterized protein OCT59_016776 [Rhizophagus irregularis]|uniref:uncharacterized protein n=1 Tax=Rhizophagus irregularis TaxID=588596 RepID=UPI00332181E2|nr:hypothetical protein OCT59_016776 [Rhizophagus irregularis]